MLLILTLHADHELAAYLKDITARISLPYIVLCRFCRSDFCSSFSVFQPITQMRGGWSSATIKAVQCLASITDYFIAPTSQNPSKSQRGNINISKEIPKSQPFSEAPLSSRSSSPSYAPSSAQQLPQNHSFQDCCCCNAVVQPHPISEAHLHWVFLSWISNPEVGPFASLIVDS